MATNILVHRPSIVVTAESDYSAYDIKYPAQRPSDVAYSSEVRPFERRGPDKLCTFNDGAVE